MGTNSAAVMPANKTATFVISAITAAEFVANKPLLYACCADLYKQDSISCKKNIFTV